MAYKNLSSKAKKFVSQKISKLHDEGYRGQQAIAIAHSMARKKKRRMTGGEKYSRM